MCTACELDWRFGICRIAGVAQLCGFPSWSNAVGSIANLGFLAPQSLRTQSTRPPIADDALIALSTRNIVRQPRLASPCERVRRPLLFVPHRRPFMVAAEARSGGVGHDRCSPQIIDPPPIFKNHHQCTTAPGSAWCIHSPCPKEAWEHRPNEPQSYRTSIDGGYSSSQALQRLPGGGPCSRKPTPGGHNVDQSQSATSKAVGFIPDSPYDYIRMFGMYVLEGPATNIPAGSLSIERQLRVCFTPSRKSWWI